MSEDVPPVERCACGSYACDGCPICCPANPGHEAAWRFPSATIRKVGNPAFPTPNGD